MLPMGPEDIISRKGTEEGSIPHSEQCVKYIKPKKYGPFVIFSQ